MWSSDLRGFGLTLSPIHPPYGGVTVNLQYESEKAARFSTEKVLATVLPKMVSGFLTVRKKAKSYKLTTEKADFVAYMP